MNNKAHPNTIIALCGNKLDKVKGGGSEKAAREVDKEVCMVQVPGDCMLLPHP